MQYLSQEHLIGFENYKYSAKDTSPLSKYVMHPFWNAVVKWCPRTIAPNVLTFVGFLFTAANFVLLSFYDYYYYGASDQPPGDKYPPIPNWLWFLMALNHFLAHTLDGIDGKQARRTNTSSPLGELFDHGLDSWTAFFIPTCLWSVFGRHDYSITPWRFYFVVFNVLICFYTSHWEKYLTKVLFLPWGYDVSQVIIFVIYIVTGIYGTEFWKFELLPGVASGSMFEFMLYAGSLASSLPMSFYNIYCSYRDGTGKMLGFVEAVRPLWNPVLLFTLCTVWLMYSPTDIVDRDPRLFLYLIGVVFANINCRLIVSQMSSTRCELLNWQLLLMVVCVSVAFMLPVTEMFLLIVLSTVATAAHIHYGVQVVRQMCSHFHIQCFSIKDRID
ncbi:CDP-alcohol phosphatidyltransferase [Trinorchestia longiramus]|nr:CDP-alcohol phosphatidyltransferase [Trinorchestia longiramus]